MTPSQRETDERLCERLEETRFPERQVFYWPYHPDGPEASRRIRELWAEIDRLRGK